MPQPQFPFLDSQDENIQQNVMNMRQNNLSDPFGTRGLFGGMNQEEQNSSFSQKSIHYQRIPQDHLPQNPSHDHALHASYEEDELVHPSHVIERTEDKRQTRLLLLKAALEEIQKNLTKAFELIGDELRTPSSISLSEISQAQTLTKKVQEEFQVNQYSRPQQTSYEQTMSYGQSRIIEGIFDGQHMIGPDGKTYTIPPNYASKSKLVEGDGMKLTITQQGTFMYKQIAPTQRNRAVGNLVQDQQTREHYVLIGDRRWKILTASVTYYKGIPGDEVIILIPRDGASKWAAVDNIIKKNFS